MELKSGYKHTQVGMIPDGWKVLTIFNIAPMQRGFDLPSSQRKDGAFPVVYSNGIVNFHSEPRVHGPGVVTGRSGTLGRVHYVEGDYWPHNTTLWVTKFNGNSPLFIFYLFNRICFDRFGSGSGVPTLNRNDVHSLLAAIPGNASEQIAIATALSDVDALLAAQDSMIAKQRGIKQGAMQELLIGKRRLPGFVGEWKVSSLKQLADIRPGINKPLSHMGSGVLYVTVQDLYDGTSIRTERLSRIMVSPSEIEARSLIPGDIVFGKSSVKREGIGYPSQFHGCDEPVVFSGFAYRARVHHTIADAEFLFYGLRSERTRRWLIDNSQASALTNINQTIADAIPIDLPPTLTEQAAIAKILKDMDAAIAELETKREKTALLKQGMMQELLTGRIRLLDEAA